MVHHCNLPGKETVDQAETGCIEAVFHSIISTTDDVNLSYTQKLWMRNKKADPGG